MARHVLIDLVVLVGGLIASGCHAGKKLNIVSAFEALERNMQAR